MEKTESGIYYLHEYYPRRLFGDCLEAEREISQQVWDYKNLNKIAVSRFTDELMEAIAELAEKTSSDKIGLVAVPPSEPDKYSAIKLSISRLAKMYQDGIVQEKYNCRKQILDYSDLLVRTKNVATSHQGRRATYQQHRDSIECSRDGLSKLWTTFIIIDDITTRGTVMKACRDILIDHGAYGKYIYQLAIGRTILGD